MSILSKTANKSNIDLHITSNGSNEITGAQLNTILENLVDSYEDFIRSLNADEIGLIESPTTRDVVFNTTRNSFYFYDGTRWVAFSNPKYKVYTALLSQTGTGAPAATVLENMLGGTVVWSREAQGVFRATLTGAFTTGKTGFFIQPMNNATHEGFFLHSASDEDYVEFHAVQSSDESDQDDTLANTLIEIRVYY